MARLRTALRMIFALPGFVGLLAANFAQGMAYSFVVPFMSKWGTEHVGMSPQFFGIFMTVTSLCAIVFSTLLARWSDAHVTRRTMLIIGAVGGAVGYAGYAFVSDKWILLAIGSLCLSLASVTFSQIFAHLREELARPEHAGLDAALLTSVARIAFSLAWIAGPSLGAWVKNHFDYTGSFLGATALFLVFLAGILLFVPHRPHPPITHQKEKGALRDAIAQPVVVLSFAAFVLYFAAHSMGLMNLPLLVTGELGGDFEEVGFIYGIAPVVEIPLMIWSGQLAARGHMMALLRFGAIAGTLYFCGLPFVDSPAHIYPLQILSAVAIGILTNIAITHFQDAMPGHTGLAGSLYSNSFNVGSLLGYFTFGQCLPLFGQRGLFWVCAAFALGTVLLLLRVKQASAPTKSPLP